VDPDDGGAVVAKFHFHPIFILEEIVVDWLAIKGVCKCRFSLLLRFGDFFIFVWNHTRRISHNNRNNKKEDLFHFNFYLKFGCTIACTCNIILQLESVKGIDRKIDFASTQCLFIMQDGVKDEKEAKNVEKG
jgi:hypothetical protein